MKVAVYGTLRYGARANGLMEGGKYLGRDTITGKMYNLGSFPGLCLSPSKSDGEDTPAVVVDVYEVTPEILKDLDRYEGYHPDDASQSLYLRKDTVTAGGIPVQVYEYNAPVGGLPPVKSGDWFNERF